MSLKTLLMPIITERMLSARLEQKRWHLSERQRVKSGAGHVVQAFVQVDDPYSAMVALALPMLQARYPLRIEGHLVSAPDANAAPERERLVTYGRLDAQRLAQQQNLNFKDPGYQPSPADSFRTAQALAAAAAGGRFVEAAAQLLPQLWQQSNTGHDPLGMDWPAASVEETTGMIQRGDRLRHQLGHYLGGMLYYGGEWYWGTDRLHYLEQRLHALGVGQGGQAPLFSPPDPLALAERLDSPPPIDFFVSLRSPYSAIVTPRVFELGRRTGAPVRLRYVLPMVMRGLPVPSAKRRYISLDVAREARHQCVPFGRINDPVGRPTERGLAVMPLAERQGAAEAYLQSFMRGVWAEGIDAGSDRGLQRITNRAGLHWPDVQTALQDTSWRLEAETNRRELFELGLWGVPSFRVADTVAWGQDRLWVIEQALRNGYQSLSKLS
jgi:2-hydroxychromene-2-carboxylate isomerase